MKKISTTYDRENKLVISELSGLLDEDDIDSWERSLVETLNKLEAGSKFKILINLHGFKAANFEVHKKFRVIVPQTLASYGWYVGYLRMFPEASLCITSNNGIHCIAAAHVHQDESKIRNYAENYSMRNEAFFTDPHVAEQWIREIAVA